MLCELKKKRWIYSVGSLVGLIGGVVTVYSGMDNVGEFVLYRSSIGVMSSRKSILINTLELKEAWMCYNKIISNICDLLKNDLCLYAEDIIKFFSSIYDKNKDLYTYSI